MAVDTEEEVLIECADCGDKATQEIVSNEWTVNADFADICEACGDSYVSCTYCGELSHEDNVYCIRDEALCDDCFVDHTTDCNDCGDRMFLDDSTWIESDGCHVCDRCVEDYFYCEGCDTMYHIDYYGHEGYCGGCSEDEYGEDADSYPNVRRWGDKPDLQYVDKEVSYTPKANAWYMGMEIEVEHSNDAVSNALPHLGKVWGTTDASLDSGIEVITHPGTFDAWMNGSVVDWAQWQTRLHGMVSDQGQYNTNGIHVHVSRTAFNDGKGRRKASHLYKFMQFIDKNKYVMQLLAGRENQSYCQWDTQRDGPTRVKDVKGNRSPYRYRPVNTQNRDTVELRFFNGLTDPTFMKRTIQLIHAMVEYTRTAKVTDKRDWSAFVEYVDARKDMYAELWQYIDLSVSALLSCAVESESEYLNEVMPKVRANAKAKKITDSTPFNTSNGAYSYNDDDEYGDCDCNYCTNERR